jgi:hypothetical protein
LHTFGTVAAATPMLPVVTGVFGGLIATLDTSLSFSKIGNTVRVFRRGDNLSVITFLPVFGSHVSILFSHETQQSYALVFSPWPTSPVCTVRASKWEVILVENWLAVAHVIIDLSSRRNCCHELLGSAVVAQIRQPELAACTLQNTTAVVRASQQISGHEIGREPSPLL